MTREEKQKAIDALKISAPIMAVTQEEFKDYIQTLNKIMDWLEQEPSVLQDIKSELWMEGMNMAGEYQGVWVRYRDIERVIDKHISESEDKE